MSPNERKIFTDSMASLDRNERAKLMKRAAQLRKLDQVRRPKTFRVRARDNDDEDGASPIHRGKSLEDYMWQILSVEQEATEPTGPTETLTVLGVVKNGVEVLRDGQTVLCRTRTKESISVAAGDQAIVELRGDELFLAGVAPRRSRLSRPDVDNPNRERVIAANVDVVVLVVSVVSPPLHPRLIDRYLLAIEYGGCSAVLAVNKLDLTDTETRSQELAKLEPYRQIGLPIFECVARTGEGVSALRSSLAGQVAAFVGHSGVGKSSLINAFDSRLSQDVGEVSEGYGRGTHTTTRSSLIDLGDLKVIDTPGVRSFGLWNIRAEEVKLYFPEFESAGQCRFRDCRHLDEPGCAVKSAVEEDRVSPWRYDVYRRLMEEL